MDSLEVQISIRLKLPPGYEPTSGLVDDLVRYHIDTGQDHPRARIRIIRWRNADRKGSLKRWRTGNQNDAWETLGRALKAGRIRISATHDKDIE